MEHEEGWSLLWRAWWTPPFSLYSLDMSTDWVCSLLGTPVISTTGAVVAFKVNNNVYQIWCRTDLATNAFNYRSYIIAFFSVSTFFSPTRDHQIAHDSDHPSMHGLTWWMQVSLDIFTCFTLGHQSYVSYATASSWKPTLELPWDAYGLLLLLYSSSFSEPITNTSVWNQTSTYLILTRSQNLCVVTSSEFQH